MSKKRSNWYKLDNAAKIFPPSSSNYDPKVFRFTCELYEDIDENRLQFALDKTLIEYPVFNSEIKNGFFWNYLEISTNKHIVKKEYKRPCSRLDNDILFEVTYFKNRINLEVSHVLSDGTGSLEFIKSLVDNYLSYKQDEKELLNDSSTIEKESDSFLKYYNPKVKWLKSIKKRAYKVKGKKYSNNQIKIIEGIASTEKIKEIAKKYDTTITIFLTAVLIKSIEQTLSTNDKKKPIVITVPVDLRKYYPSKTVRNFFNVINVSYCANNSNSNIEEIILEIKKQFASYLSDEQIESTMNKNAWLEKMLIVRIIPNIIKTFVIKLVYYLSRNYQTMTLSNLGNISLPSNIKDKIKLFDVMCSTDGIQLCMCSYQDNMTFTFTSHFINTEIQKNYFRTLAKYSDIIINTNDINEGDEDE